jgi:hypothetical protein
MEINTKTENLQRHLAMVECLVLGAVCVSCARTFLGGACSRNPLDEGRREGMTSDDRDRLKSLELGVPWSA